MMQERGKILYSLGETIDTRCDRTFVGQESRDTTLVLRSSTTDESRVVDETVFGSVSFRLESTEESFLGTEDLNGRGRVF